MTVAYWPDEYIQKKKSVSEAIKLIRAGQRVFIGSSCAEPQVVVKELADEASCFTDLEIVRILSIESAPLTLIAEETQCHSFNVRSFYLGSGKPRALSESKRFLTPINLSQVPRLFKSGALPIHVALIQCAPPDDFGWMSLGVSVDVTLAAAQSADMVIAQVNRNMPRVLGRSFIHVNDVDVIVEHDEEILSIGGPPEVPSAQTIGKHVARLIDDGSTLQISLGSSPQATLQALSEKNDLGIHTQFLTKGILNLVAQGVITNRKKGINEGKLVASSAVGDRDLYDWLHDNPSIEFHPSDYVNNPAIIARHNKMVAMNVAMGIDLTGQVVADALPYNHFSGVSGIMDFTRGAMASPQGKSVIMLASTTMDGRSSRIVPQLRNIPVVVPRGDVQYVVTEYGMVNLFGKSLQERALALISIAHPDFRDELFYRASEMGLLGRERTMADSLHGIYPIHLEEIIKVDGAEFFIRPSKPTDERLLQEHFYGLDRESIMKRFMHEKSSFLREEVDDFSQVDYVKNLTLVAVTGEPGFEKVIGMATYLLEPAKNLAEVAYSVSKPWQGKGIGGIMQAKLVQAARENGFRGVVAYTSHKNRGMVKLFNKLPYKIQTTFDEDMLILRAEFVQQDSGTQDQA